MKLDGPALPAKLVPTELSTKHPVKQRPADAGIARSEVSPRGVPKGAAPEQIQGFKELALSLGLPQDKLSSSLFSFIKFFSLPLAPKLIQQLRQEVLSVLLPSKEGGPKTGQEKANPRSLASIPAGRIQSGALAAAAAAGKGVVLSTEALEKYAAAITGEEGDDGGDTEQNGTDQGEGPGDRHGGDTDGNRHKGGAKHAGPQDGGGKTDIGHHAEGGLSPDQIRSLAEGIEGRSPLLGMLNKLRGKDGRRWINLPFSFSSGNVEFRVALRIVLADTNTIPWKTEWLNLDIATGGARRSWSFTLENGGGNGGPSREVPVFARALVCIHPPPERPAAMERTLRELLGTVAEEIVLKDTTEEEYRR